MIRVISFDLDGTIIDRKYNDYFWLEVIPRTYAEEKGLKLSEAKRIVYSKYDEIGDSDIRWYLPDFWLKYLGIKRDLNELIREAFRESRPYPYVKPLLYILFKMKIKIILCTNAPRKLATSILNCLSIKSYFRKTYSCVSDYSLVRKTRSFYAKVIKDLKVSASSIVHIGDNFTYDYKIPVSLGIKAILVKNPETLNYLSLYRRIISINI
ncbi:MAG: hypothetical protein DRJ63_08690 [Thermoprotei archaeon]|nr:MAG: hypothetical protein DRJ63_08690 [Thermoprotei archaeon]